MSLGTDGYELLAVRGETIPGAARLPAALGAGITICEPGAPRCPTGWGRRPKAARR